MCFDAIKAYQYALNNVAIKGKRVECYEKNHSQCSVARIVADGAAYTSSCGRLAAVFGRREYPTATARSAAQI